MSVQIKRLFVTGVALSALTGCSLFRDVDPPKPDQSTAASVSQAPATGPTGPLTSQGPLPSQDQLNEALLTTAELGPTYTAMPAQNSPVGQIGAGVSGCSEAGTEVQPSVNGQSVFQGGPVGPFVADAITVANQPDTIRVMQSLSKVSDNCSSFGGEAGAGIKMDVNIERLTFPRVADEVVGFRLTATMQGGGAIYAHVVAVRTGNVIVLVTMMQLTSPDVAVTEKVVRLAVTKAEQHLRH